MTAAPNANDILVTGAITVYPNHVIVLHVLSIKDSRYLEYWDRRIEGMRKTGAPEE